MSRPSGLCSTSHTVLTTSWALPGFSCSAISTRWTGSCTRPRPPRRQAKTLHVVEQVDMLAQLENSASGPGEFSFGNHGQGAALAASSCRPLMDMCMEAYCAPCKSNKCSCSLKASSLMSAVKLYMEMQNVKQRLHRRGSKSSSRVLREHPCVMVSKCVTAAACIFGRVAGAGHAWCLQEVSVGPAGALPADLAILATAADQLFESTSRMSTESVESMLIALQSVSSGSIPAAAAQPGPPK